jgi:hypothetical protein
MQKVFTEIGKDLRKFLIEAGRFAQKHGESRSIAECRRFIEEYLDLEILSKIPETKDYKFTELIKIEEEEEEECF